MAFTLSKGSAGMAEPVKIIACGNRRFGASAPCCHKRGAAETLEALRRAIKDSGLAITVEVGPCLGLCTVGPNLRVVGDSLLRGVTADTVDAVIERVRPLARPADADPAPSESSVSSLAGWG